MIDFYRQRRIPMLRFCQTLVVTLVLLPPGAMAQDMSHSEKQRQDRLETMDRSIGYLEKQLEVMEANHDLEKKRLDIAELRKKRAEAELETARANAERLAPDISKIEAIVMRVDDPEKRCDASAYVLFHCKGKPRCEFDLKNEDMCKLPGAVTDEMIVSVTFRCAGARDFSNQTFPFDAPKGFLTCF